MRNEKHNTFTALNNHASERLIYWFSTKEGTQYVVYADDLVDAIHVLNKAGIRYWDFDTEPVAAYEKEDLYKAGVVYKFAELTTA